MKFRKIIFGTVAATVLVAYSSCKKVDDFGDLNRNPNATTEPITAALFTNVIANLGNNLVWDQGGVNTVSGLYAQFFSETQYTEASRYAKPTFNFDGYYSGPLYDLQNIINYNRDQATASKAATFGSSANQIAIARILKARYFKMLTDVWGDIPYSQALKGSGLPSYDPQQQIYTDLIKELKEAVDQFDNGPTVQGDILFNGNTAAWKRYANSLRLLIALQLSKANAAMGKTEFQAALSHPAGVIETNSQNATINYPGGNYRNPFYNYYEVTQRRDYAVSKTVTDRLTNTNDPRINAFTTTKVGFPYGLTRENAVSFANQNSNWTFIMAPQWRRADAPLSIMTAANIWLARAEAAFKGWISESVATDYMTGIQRSLEQWNVYNAGTFATYMAQSSVALTSGTELEKIATQEWITWFPNGVEAWNVWRRTSYPSLTPAPGQAAIPRRFPYGPNEYNLNPENVKAAAARYNAGGVEDSQFSRLWFDVQ